MYFYICSIDLPKLPHSLYTNVFASLLRKHSATSAKLFSSCGQLTASANRNDLKITQRKQASFTTQQWRTKKKKICQFHKNLRTASFRSTMAHGVVGEPLCSMALWNKSRDIGDSKCNETDTAPALSPNNVTRLASPPK